MYVSTGNAWRPNPPCRESSPVSLRLATWPKLEVVDLSEIERRCTPARQGRRQRADQMPVVIEQVAWPRRGAPGMTAAPQTAHDTHHPSPHTQRMNQWPTRTKPRTQATPPAQATQQQPTHTTHQPIHHTHTAPRSSDTARADHTPRPTRHTPAAPHKHHHHAPPVHPTAHPLHTI